MAYMQPQAAMTSLLCKINSKGEIVQDTGTGGAWPCSTDRQVWVAAAWELYKVTGSREWLEKVYPVAKKSLEVDMRTIYDEQTGFAKGESSFIDWRKNSYPLWMEDKGYYAQFLAGRNDDILYTKSETLGQSLAILYGVAEGERADRLSQSMPVVGFGAPVFWPWIPDQPPYIGQSKINSLI